MNAQSVGRKYFCQGCCGGIGVYYLGLAPDSTVETFFYSSPRGGREISTFGVGNFKVENDLLIVVFRNLPGDTVISTKTRQSDSLIVRFSVFDNLRGDSIALVNVSLNGGKEIFYNNSHGTLKAQFKGSATISFSAFTFNSLGYKITEPGEYDVRIGLIPEADNYLRGGEVRRFRVVKENSGESYEEVGGPLTFTRRSCGKIKKRRWRARSG